MLTVRTIRKLKQVGGQIQRAETAFLDVIREALQELGGVEWSKRDLPSLFRQLEKETVGPLCTDKDGPQLSRDSYKYFMSAARKSLLFGIPFQFAGRISYEDLPKVKAIVDKDKRKSLSVDEKVKEAIQIVRAEKRELQKQNVEFIKLTKPTLDDGDTWVSDLYESLAAVLETPAAQILMRDNPELKKLAKLVVTRKNVA